MPLCSQLHSRPAFITCAALYPIRGFHPTSSQSAVAPRSHFCPRFARTYSFVRPLVPFRFSLPRSFIVSPRQAPVCHSTCHSHSHLHDNSQDHSNDHDSSQSSPSASACCSPAVSQNALNPDNPLVALITRLASQRLSIRVAIASGITLFLAAMLHVFTPSLPLLSRIPLAITLLLTGIPSICDVALRLASSRAAALNVEVLMTLAAVISALSGALFESALLTTLYTLSFAAEDQVSRRARTQLDALTRLAPTQAQSITSATDSNPATVPLSEIKPGMLLLVRVGELAPADGTVEHSSVQVSLSHLTGESVPASLSVGASVSAGAMPVDTALVLRVTRPVAESFLARISRLVTDAQSNRPPVTRFFDRFGTLYARIVLITALCVAAFLPLITRGMLLLPVLRSVIRPIAWLGKAGSLARGLGVLVVGAPCALLIGAPVAYLSALSAAARRGVLVKGGARALAATAAARNAVFDKTGTLTTGRLQLVSTVALPIHGGVPVRVGAGTSVTTSDNGGLAGLPEVSDFDLQRVVAAAAALERGAVHPVAEAVRRKATELDVALPVVDNAKVVAGQGVEGMVSLEDDEGSLIIAQGRLGRPSFILTDYEDMLSMITSEASKSGETVSVLEVGGEVFMLRMKDEVRKESADVVQALQRLGMDVSVLTGDASGAASFVGAMVGKGVRVLSNATPDEKLDYVKRLRGSNGRNGIPANGNGRPINSGALMVGDGVNDAAALGASLVGVACGLNSGTAVEAADVVLVRQDLRNVEWLVRKARATERVVKQNTVIALGLMVISAIACAGGVVPLWLAVTLHEGGTVLVGLNGLRLLGER